MAYPTNRRTESDARRSIMANTKALGRIWAVSPLVPSRDPGVDKWKLGFVAEIPTFQVLNYLHNRMDNNIVALAERGIFEWGSDITYAKGAMAWDSNGKIYIAKVASPAKDKTPPNNPTQWEESVIQTPKSRFTTLDSLVNSHINNKANPHRLTAAQLNSYTKQEYDATIATITANLASHESNYSNSHNVTAAQVGAVPITGGTYSGAVTFSTGSIGLGTDTTNAVMSQSGKVFLKKGNMELGVNADGKPYFKNNTETLLLDETLFIALKKQQERFYAVSQPDVEYNFLSDINTLRGMGHAEFSSPGGKTYTNKAGATVVAAVDEPRHTKAGLAFIDSTERLDITKTYDGKSFTDTTEHIEIALDSYVNSYWFSIFQDTYPYADYFFITGTGQVRYRLFVGTTDTDIIGPQLSGTGKHSLTRVIGADKTLRLYVDGVLFHTGVWHNKDKASWLTTQCIVFGATLTKHVYLRRYRCWASKLTDNQVATL